VAGRRAVTVLRPLQDTERVADVAAMRNNEVTAQNRRSKSASDDEQTAL
jgi:hypothetical protein